MHPDTAKPLKQKGHKHADGLKKVEMIRAIQRAEGNFDCFGTASNYCDQLSSLFRQDCLK